jgi:hypothetical protein
MSIKLQEYVMSIIDQIHSHADDSSTLQTGLSTLDLFGKTVQN